MFVSAYMLVYLCGLRLLSTKRLDETGDFLGYHSFPEEMLKEAGGDYVLIQVCAVILFAILIPVFTYRQLVRRSLAGAL